jgi:hypothetical protein
MNGSCGRLEVVLAKDAAEAFCDWVREQWGREPVTLEAPRGTRAVVEIYFDTPEEAEARRRRLPGHVALSGARAMACPEAPWTTFWRRHFPTRDIGRNGGCAVWEKAPDRGGST